MREQDRRPAVALSRRRLLVLAALAPAATALAGCSGDAPGADGPDPLIALADAARADAALAAAAIAADPALADRVEPLRLARTEHAAALAAALAPDGTAAPSPAAAPPAAGPVPLSRVRAAAEASATTAADLVPGMPAERVGLVASISACCATYAAVLT